MRTLGLIMVLGWALLLTGCGHSRPARVPVSGQVLIDGKPLTFGAVMFVPEKGRGSSGVLDEQGHFVLTCYEQGDGALIGKHKVRIIGGKSINDDVTEWYAPKKYAEVATSGLSEEISQPVDSLVINLTWQGDEHGKQWTERTNTNRGNRPRALRE